MSKQWLPSSSLHNRVLTRIFGAEDAYPSGLIPKAAEVDSRLFDPGAPAVLITVMSRNLSLKRNLNFYWQNSSGTAHARLSHRRDDPGSAPKTHMSTFPKPRG